MAWAIFWFPILLWLAPLKGWALFDCGLGFSFFNPLFCSFLQSYYHFLLHYSVIPAVMSFDPSLLGSFGPVAYSSLNDSVWSLDLLLHYLRALVSHLYPFGHPRPFLILCSNGLLLTLLSFPSPITLFFILGAYGLALNPLLSSFVLLWACCGPFSLFYVTYYPWVCYFFISGLP